MSSSMRAGSPVFRRVAGPSALRTALNGLRDDSPSASTEQDVEAGPSGSQMDGGDPITPRKARSRADTLAASVNGMDSPSTESVRTEPESPGEDQPAPRERYQRRAARNAQHFCFLKRPRKSKAAEPVEDIPVDDEDEDCVRCATCAKAMHERIWYNNKYFDHCARPVAIISYAISFEPMSLTHCRCVRHALIFDLPWPAHRSTDVLDYPPAHLIPAGYIPPRVSSIALPSLDKHRKKHVEPAPVSPQGETHAERRARKFRQECAMEDLRIEQLREAAWTTQDTAETQAKAAIQAKIDAKAKKIEEKRLKDQNKIKGSGVWSRYEYIDEAELERRRLARMAVTTGTRRGGRFKPPESDEEDKQEDEEEGGVAAGNQAGPSRSAANGVRLDSNGSGASEANIENHDQLALALPSRQVTPVGGVVPKAEPLSSGRSMRVRDMETIDLFSEESGYNSSEIVCLDPPTEALIANATKVTAKRGGEISDDGSSVVEVENSPKQRSHGFIKQESNGKSKASPSRSRPGIAKPTPSLARRAESVSGSTSGQHEGSESPTKRGRGRPKGSGKKQRAAALHASRAKPATESEIPSSIPQASPSRPSKRNTPKSKAYIDTEDEMSESEQLSESVVVRRSPKQHKGKETVASESNETGQNLLSRIEQRIKELAKATPYYQWMIEALDSDGGLAWKALRQSPGQTPFPPEAVLRDFADTEHGEYLRQLGSSDNNRPASDKRPLPGLQTLVNRAEVLKWQPARLSPQGADKAKSIHLDKPYKVVSDLEVVGYTVDTYACGKGEPDTTSGPWRNGHYRMIAARALTDSQLLKLGHHTGQIRVEPESGNGKGRSRADAPRQILPSKAFSRSPQVVSTSKSSDKATNGKAADPVAPSAPVAKAVVGNTRQMVNGSISTSSSAIKRKDSSMTSGSSAPKPKLTHNLGASTLAALDHKFRNPYSPSARPSASTVATTSTQAAGVFANGQAHPPSQANGKSSTSASTTRFVIPDNSAMSGLYKPGFGFPSAVKPASGRPNGANGTSAVHANGRIGDTAPKGLGMPPTTLQNRLNGSADSPIARRSDTSDALLARYSAAIERDNKRKSEFALSVSDALP